MTTIARAVLAAITLLGPTLAVAASGPTEPHSKPSSYAPRPHSDSHVYGTPIGPPIVGHRKPSHHVPARSTQPSGATMRKVHQANARRAGDKGAPQAVAPHPSLR
jgi:hypothetical protein